MARKKVKLAFIVNDSARKATYNKRKKSLLKKMNELTTLCGIQACAIVYSPYDPTPEVWPSPWGVQSVLSKFRTRPEVEQTKKMVNQETFLEQRVIKANEHVVKQQKENKDQELTLFLFQCLAAGNIVNDNMSEVDLNELTFLIEKNLKDIDRRLETMDMNDQVVAPSQVNTTTPAQTSTTAPAESMAQNKELSFIDWI